MIVRESSSSSVKTGPVEQGLEFSADIQLLSTLAMTLAEGFEEDYAGGYAYVEGFYGASGWQRN